MKPLVVLLLLIISSCEQDKFDRKDVEKLKEAFSCTVNGEEFYPKQFSDIYYTAGYKEFSKNGYSTLTLKSRNTINRLIEVLIIVSNTEKPFKAGEIYPLELANFSAPRDLKYADCYYERSGAKEPKLVEQSSYTTNDDIGGSLTITYLDTITNTVRGSFQFKAINKAGDMIKVENGSFNFNYED